MYTKSKKQIKTDISKAIKEDFGTYYSNFIPKIEEIQTTLSTASSSMEYFKWLDFDYLKKINTKTKELALQFQNYPNAFVLGMGGSGINSLILKNSLFEFAAKKKSSINLIIQNNLDPSSMLARLNELNLDQTSFIIISKSGSTDEVRRNLNTLINYWQANSPVFDWSKLAKQCLIITEPKSSKKNFLHDFADELKSLSGIELAYLENDPNIGGRFSLFSPVGMFSAALMGLDTDAMIESARKIFEEFLQENAKQNTIASLALLDIKLSRSGFANRYSMVYSDSLESLNKFRAQLKGESLNKNQIDSTVHIPGIGTVNHHSDLELLLKNNNGVLLEQIFFLKPFADHINKASLKSLEDLSLSSNHQVLLDKHIHPLAKYISEKGAPIIQTTLLEQNENSIAEFCMQDMLVTIVQAGLQDALGENLRLDLAIRQWEVERYKKSVN